MFEITIRDTDRQCEIDVVLDIKISSETSIPLSMITEEYLTNELDRLKYNLLELAAKQIMNERNNLNV